MRLKALPSLLTGFILLTSTIAATNPKFSAEQMRQSLSGDGIDLAAAGAPVWFFGEPQGHFPCYPTFPVNDEGQQTPAGELCDFPDTDCNCREPWISDGKFDPSFPVYFSFRECDSEEVQVAYNLFYEKDGFSPEGIFGHAYDWEYVIVIWKKTAYGENGDSSWSPTHLLLSAHGKLASHNWMDCDMDEETGKPKVYTSWAKHAHYAEPMTNKTTLLREMTEDAYRGEDWWYYPREDDLIKADRSTDMGKLIESFDWGQAVGNPAVVHDRLCTDATAEQ
ncbi:hypothetical protein SMACR_00564 [Sordaria macrospora]|uniref:WGS project CABT00000000 data, contig 2.1 n=2 Tax=Sordaria macrospora TaxID=5147 RepID=F7VLH1_SORMK|nr:uncharacterized protein SMAC_00564 [Sordaria macrospora k-hell]KAA8635469.1 hypothetical protein SMACR_00564 [Sordaria macrospora]WPJ59315.1 hypothetical protein SMAC4_00564 [Sordaria macrospora]CCC06349.1 unnamed protein product [Sordaria macrospora k-hell]